MVDRVYQREDYLRLAFDGLAIPKGTPARVAKWLEEYAGEKVHANGGLPEEITRGIFTEHTDYNEIVIVKDIRFTALCEHHLLPFQGRAAVGYIPHGLVLGISKLARVVHLFTHTPTLQEAITKSVADSLNEALDPEGVMVVLYDVVHSCMSMRGVHEKEATTTTSAVRGLFRTDSAARAEFLSLMK